MFSFSKVSKVSKKHDFTYQPLQSSKHFTTPGHQIKAVAVAKFKRTQA